MNYYFDAGILQVPHYTGCQVYVDSMLVELAQLAPNDTFHLHFSMDGWNPQIDTLLNRFPNLIPHIYPGAFGRHCMVPVNILKTKSRAFFMLNGNSGLLRIPVPVPSAVLFHDMRLILCKDIYGEKICDDFIKSAKSWIPKHNFIVTGSETVKKEIIDYFGLSEDRIIVASESMEHRSANGQSTCPELLLKTPQFIAMINPGEIRKNWQDVLKAFSHYIQEYKEDNKTILVLAGNLREETVPIETYLQNNYKLRSRCILLGYISNEELTYIYKNAIFSVYMSRYEGFGIPILESMGHGLPVIVSDIPVFHEVAGKSALYVPLDNPEELSSQMRRLITDTSLRKDLTSHGYEQITSFSWRHSAEKILTMLQRMAS